MVDFCWLMTLMMPVCNSEFC